MNTFVALDGVLQSSESLTENPIGDFRHGGWLVPYADAELLRHVGDTLTNVDALLLGRRTYEIFARHWSRIVDLDDPVALILNLLPNYVVSTTLRKLEWPNSRLIQGDVLQEVANLKRRYESEIQIPGSSELAQTLIDNDLIDEYRLCFCPVIMGSGKRLFGPARMPLALTLVDTQTTSARVMINTYRRAGTPRYRALELDRLECDPVREKVSGG